MEGAEPVSEAVEKPGRSPGHQAGSERGRGVGVTVPTCETASVEPAQARAVWHELEAIHAVTYFAPECRDAMKGVGLRGFWMGYFASRAAPLGPATAGVVTAAFYNFRPDMVGRSIPDAWKLATPASILAARADAAAAALHRLAPGARTDLATLLAVLHRSIEQADGEGRALFTANRAVTTGGVGVGLGGLWQAATTLREHRGDAHVAVLTGSGLDWCEAHVLFAAARGEPPAVLRDNRGWTADDGDRATDRLRRRGLVTAGGGTTADGHRLHEDVERRTDELAAQPYATLSPEEVGTVIRGLRAVARRVVAAGEIPFPNPIGLPAPGRDG